MPYNPDQHQANIILAYLNRTYPEIWFHVKFAPAKGSRRVNGVTEDIPDRIVISFVLPPHETKRASSWQNILTGRMRRFKDRVDKISKTRAERTFWYNRDGAVVVKSEHIVDLRRVKRTIEENYQKPAEGGPWRQVTFWVQEYEVINVDPTNVNLTFKRGLDGRRWKCKVR